jgi:hypothetical protein
MSDQFYTPGWINDPAAVARVQSTLAVKTFGVTPAAQVSDDDLPKSVYLWEAFRKLFGKLPDAKNQGQVGSCVSFGTNTAIRRTMACEILAGDPEEFLDIVEEVTYGGSRVEVGGGKIGGDGSVGAWAAKFVLQWGVVARGVYGSYDLSKYSESTCRKFGSSGVPAELETEAKSHPVKTTTLVESWADAKRAIASGYGLAVCSDQGFSMQRDSNGICRASGTWNHCMAIDGYQIDGGKEYGHITNSWGAEAHTGTVGWGDPGTDGFWADSATIDRMIRQGDTWAFSSVVGFPLRKLSWLI